MFDDLAASQLTKCMKIDSTSSHVWFNAEIELWKGLVESLAFLASIAGWRRRPTPIASVHKIKYYTNCFTIRNSCTFLTSRAFLLSDAMWCTWRDIWVTWIQLGKKGPKSIFDIWRLTVIVPPFVVTTEGPILDLLSRRISLIQSFIRRTIYSPVRSFERLAAVVSIPNRCKSDFVLCSLVSFGISFAKRNHIRRGQRLLPVGTAAPMFFDCVWPMNTSFEGVRLQVFQATTNCETRGSNYPRSIGCQRRWIPLCYSINVLDCQAGDNKRKQSIIAVVL